MTVLPLVTLRAS